MFKLANDGHDTHAIQAYLGHRSIMSTVQCTARGTSLLPITDRATGSRHRAALFSGCNIKVLAS